MNKFKSLLVSASFCLLLAAGAFCSEIHVSGYAISDSEANSIRLGKVNPLNSSELKKYNIPAFKVTGFISDSEYELTLEQIGSPDKTSFSGNKSTGLSKAKSTSSGIQHYNTFDGALNELLPRTGFSLLPMIIKENFSSETNLMDFTIEKSNDGVEIIQIGTYIITVFSNSDGEINFTLASNQLINESENADPTNSSDKTIEKDAISALKEKIGFDKLANFKSKLADETGVGSSPEPKTQASLLVVFE